MPTGAMGWNKRVNRATLGEHGTRGHSRAEAYRPHIEQQRSTVQWAPASATSDSISCEGPSSPTTVSAASCTETSGPQPTAVLAWHTLPTVKRDGQAVITRSQTVNVGPWTQFSWGQIGSLSGVCGTGENCQRGLGRPGHRQAVITRRSNTTPNQGIHSPRGREALCTASYPKPRSSSSTPYDSHPRSIKRHQAPWPYIISPYVSV